MRPDYIEPDTTTFVVDANPDNVGYTTGACPYCGHTWSHRLAVTPLFTREQAADILGIGKNYLSNQWTRYADHLGLPLYRMFRGTKRRLLRAWEVQFIRNQQLFTIDHERDPASGRNGVKVVKISDKYAHAFHLLYGDQFPNYRKGLYDQTGKPLSKPEGAQQRAAD